MFPACRKFLSSDWNFRKTIWLPSYIDCSTPCPVSYLPGHSDVSPVIQPPPVWTLSCIISWLLPWIGTHSQSAVHLLLSHCDLEIPSKIGHLWKNCESVEVLIFELQCRYWIGSVYRFPRGSLSCTFKFKPLATFLLLTTSISICSSSSFETAGVPAYLSSCISHSTLSFPRYFLSG